VPAFSVKKPLTVYVVTLAILILGVVAYLKMTPDLMPNMDYPYVIVVTSDPGASPESVEKNITKPLEKALATLDPVLQPEQRLHGGDGVRGRRRHERAGH